MNGARLQCRGSVCAYLKCQIDVKLLVEIGAKVIKNDFWKTRIPTPPGR